MRPYLSKLNRQVGPNPWVDIIAVTLLVNLKRLVGLPCPAALCVHLSRRSHGGTHALTLNGHRQKVISPVSVTLKLIVIIIIDHRK